MNKEKSSVPSGLYEDEQEKWNILPTWKKVFTGLNRKTRRNILIVFIKYNVLPVTVGTVTGILIHVFYLISIPGDLLFRLTIGMMTASASILAIITAFLTFWFGNSMNIMSKSRSELKSELSKLSETIEPVRSYESGPKESILGDLREKIIKLSEKSKAFVEVTNVLINRFRRASSGTYYESVDLFKIEAAIQHFGGEWFVSYTKVFKGTDNHDFSKRIWIQAMDITRNINEINDEISRASEQFRQLEKFLPVLMSILFVLVVAIAVSIMSSASYYDNTLVLLPEIRIVFGCVLIILLPVQLVMMVRLISSLILTRYAAQEANREIDLLTTKDIEKKHNINYSEALLSEAKAIMDASGKNNIDGKEGGSEQKN